MKFRLIASLTILLAPFVMHSATIQAGDVTALLGPDFLIDGASTGGTDTNSDGSGNIYIRKTLDLSQGPDGSNVSITGIGWASSGTGTTATEVTVTITHLGADAVFGTADDIELGSQTDTLSFSGASEYYWTFDTPISGIVTSSTRDFRFKLTANAPLSLKGVDFVPKLSAAGTSTAINPSGYTPAEIDLGDVTAQLGPDFLLDDAATGGTDTTTSDLFAKRVLGVNQGIDGSEVTITGIGWACAGAAATTATEATVTITYLGADGTYGTGDDIDFGTHTAAFNFAGAGEYFWAFDYPLTGTIDGSVPEFRIYIAADGNIRYKGIDFAPKLSLAGTSKPINPINQNLARLANVTASSGQSLARYATDGVVGSDFKWIMPNTEPAPSFSAPQTLEIEFPGPVEIGSYHLFHGVNNGQTTRKFRMDYYDEGLVDWVIIPGSYKDNSTADSEHNIIFSPITAKKFRLTILENYGDGRPRIREWALFPFNAGVGYPLGTGVTLNMAKDGRTEVSGSAVGQAPRLGVDGYLGSYWLSGATGGHTFEVYIRDEIDIKSVHLHSGTSSSGTPIADFDIEYRDDADGLWKAAPGATITGNTETDLVVDFTSAVRANAVRVNISDTAQVAIRELQVFPDNGASGYPLDINAKSSTPPAESYEDYSDGFYQLLSVVDGNAMTADSVGASVVTPDTEDDAQLYNVLLNAGSENYRIFNEGSREVLAVADASKAADAAVIEEPYTGFQSQQWILESASGGSVKFRNVFSGLYLEADAGTVVQRAEAAIDAQRWDVSFVRIFPKKGMAGTENVNTPASPTLGDDMGANWWYGWTANDFVTLDTTKTDYTPMQWGKANLDVDNYNAATQLPLTLRFPDWATRGYPLILMGFNEPDKSEQSNIPVSEAVELWPQVMAGSLPLLSPATAQYNNTWMQNFMAEADARDFKIDYLGMHSYRGPDLSSGKYNDPSQIILNINDLSATYADKPVILSEFGFSAFANTVSWTENDLYHAMLELLWRLENNPVVKRYSMFGFKEVSDADPTKDFSMPVDPTGLLRRSNWKYSDGTFTSIGELYMGWDGTLSPLADKPYILHNRGFDMRVHNDGSAVVDQADIRTGGPSAQVVFEDIGNGFYYITSVIDGSRLRQSSASTVEWASPSTTGTDAQWSWSQVEFGWYLITNRSTGSHLRYSDLSGIHIQANASPGEFYHWWCVPALLPSTYENWGIYAFQGAPGGTAVLAGDDPENDGKTNFEEYVLLTDPLNLDPDILTIFPGPASTVSLAFDINRYATGYSWDLYSSPDLSTSVSSWPAAPFTMESQTDDLSFTRMVIQPTGAVTDKQFFVIRVE
ncbi:hypothetical protein G0Q06_04150 [Puniceicoccales bacterium CK1056]|uniref:Asl1-like glycosyl hydrolase catalytic domain-containing protein n=1 Tax=Oceanipulchritudo coccoides TaxID=2706888 RepID=A0A6B2M1H2_9BACT|nr:glycosyl hydrolase [Oceanipulchritudo coccoides]NDV61635.1 hypothetical protein [Oceanipulchritudo coccoides]